MKSTIEQGRPYFIKAVILVAALMLLGMIAPYMSSFLIPFALVAFSAISTCGAMYYTVVKRFRRQYELNADGRLSGINRRWTFQLVGFLVAFLFSAFFFLLEAPKWDALEWVLTWAAIPVYFVVFAFSQERLKQEFGPKFYKARAMKWSFWIVGVVLCIVYALLSILLPSADYASLAEAFQKVPKPYEGAPSAIMDEAGKLSSLAQGITAFGIARATEVSLPIAIVCKFVIYASVFFGLVNQFGFCLLSKNEIKSEFQLLPGNDEEPDWEATDNRSSRAAIRYPYIAAIAIVLVASVALFLALEFKAQEARETQEYTAIEKFVNEQIEQATFIVDGAYEKVKNLEAYAKQIRELREERDEALTPMLDNYYDECRQNIGAYMEWYDGPSGAWAKFIKGIGDFGANDAINAFKDNVASVVGDTDIQSEYGQYQERINQLIYEASSLVSEDDGTQQLESLDYITAAMIGETYGELTLNLWRPLDGPEGITAAKDVLLNTDANVGRDALSENISGLIDAAQADAFEELRQGLS